MRKAKRILRQYSRPLTDTIEVSTSYWNHIDEMYSDIRQEEQETNDQLDQCIKDLARTMPVPN